MRTLKERILELQNEDILQNINDDYHRLFEMSTISNKNSFTDRKKVTVYGNDRPNFPYHFHYCSNNPSDKKRGFEFEISIKDICELNVCWVKAKLGNTVQAKLPNAWIGYRKEKTELMNWLNDTRNKENVRNWILIIRRICIVENFNPLPFGIDIGDTKLFHFDLIDYKNGLYHVNKNTNELEIKFES